MEIYDVMLGDGVIGDVAVTKEGLYVRFSCKCKLPDTQIYRLMVWCDGKKIDLGVCVPEGNWFVLYRRVQRKHIGEGKMRFSVSLNKTCSGECFVPIDPQKPFPYLASLRNVSLQKQGGCFGVLLSEKFPVFHPGMQNCQ